MCALHLRHGHIVHENGHLLATRGTKILASSLVKFHFDGVLAHERRCGAREVDSKHRMVAQQQQDEIEIREHNSID